MDYNRTVTSPSTSVSFSKDTRSCSKRLTVSIFDNAGCTYGLEFSVDGNRS